MTSLIKIISVLTLVYSCNTGSSENKLSGEFSELNYPSINDGELNGFKGQVKFSRETISFLHENDSLSDHAILEFEINKSGQISLRSRYDELGKIVLADSLVFDKENKPEYSLSSVRGKTFKSSVYNYNSNGREITIEHYMAASSEKPDFVETCSFDEKGRLLQSKMKSDLKSDFSNTTTVYMYDASGNFTGKKIIDSDNDSTVIVVGNYGELNSITYKQGKEYSRIIHEVISWDEMGNWTKAKQRTIYPEFSKDLLIGRELEYWE